MQKESNMDPNVKVFFGLIGGLALFLYGMNGMSDGLQKIAGDRMKKILGMLTKNPILGAVAGMLVTAVLQSSSATTVMVIGFVSAGLMTLPQGISVIFGANIGTTMTAQLMAFKLSDYIYPIIFIGFLLNFVAKKERLQNIGLVIFNFGLLFEGIEIMGKVMKPLATSPFFVDMMAQVAHIPVLGMLVGLCMTLVVQSSSATIAVLQNFASQAGPDGVTSVIGLSGALPILLGDNIGTTITALLACIGQSRDAKRVAIAHSTFNISGSLVFLSILPFFAQFVAWISPQGPELQVISRQIANAHTTFNLVCTVIWLPLLPLMVKIVKWVIRGGEEKEKGAFETHYLDEKMLGQPAAAMYLISKELDHLSSLTRLVMDKLRAVISQNDSASKEAFLTEYSGAKGLQDRIAHYISRLFSYGTLTEVQAERTASLLLVSNQMDRIADRSVEIEKALQSADDRGLALSDQARKDLSQCLSINQTIFDHAMKVIEEKDPAAQKGIETESGRFHKIQRKCYKDHLRRVRSKICSTELTKDYSSILYALDRMSDNCTGIAEEADHASFDNFQKPDNLEERTPSGRKS